KTIRWPCWGAVALFILLEAVTARSQEAESPAEVVGLDTLQVVGSRVADRSAQDSPVPVDIIQGEDLQTYGIRDMDALLAASVPSYNVNQHPIGQDATFVRPANLRGLPPDSTPTANAATAPPSLP
ncbi:MAG: hypothetical protein J4F42_08940, partial [Desulfurellaceae bacterium]|nr:hypothetical protein [Desulfurellaceae bacterium]